MRPKPLQPLLKEKKLSWLRSILALACLLLTASPLFAQTKTVTGTVTDAQNEPLIGVSVLIQGTASGTVTDLDGNYSISVMPENVLEFSYVGMQKQDIRVGLQTVINVVMKDDSQMLAETVVIGYGSAKKRDLTGSITNIKGEEIANKPATNPLSSLQGKIAGVQIINNGRAGDDPEIRIRGTNSINGYKPLYIVDGLFNDNINFLNPEDIESMEVLKDPSSLAIFGVRGANGVIIITTKKGVRNQAMRVNVSASLFVTDRPDLSRLNLMNASQKVDLELGLAANGRLNFLPGMGGVARILDKAGERQALVGGGGPASLSPETRSAIDALRSNGTDWGREIYRTALNQQYSVSISGGSGKTGYYFSGGYYNEQGTTVGTGFERLNLTMKTDYDLLQNLRFGASVFVGQNKNDSYLSDTDVFTNPSRYTRTVNPYLNAYNPDGSYVYDPDMTVNTGNADVLDFNFLEERARTEYTLKTRSIKTIFDLDYRPVKGLKLYTQFGLQVDNSATEKMAQENTYFTRKYQLKSMVDQVVRLPKGGVIQNWNGDLSQYNWKAQAEYAGTFGGKHELDLMAGLEMRGVTNTTVHTKGFGYDHKTMTSKPINVPEDSDLLDDESFRQYTKSFYENRYLSYFFTGSYTYDNRYTVFGSMRYDGTNLFGVDPKYKFNPMWSISGAWSINRERFLRDARWLDNLRLRVSYGDLFNIYRTT